MALAQRGIVIPSPIGATTASATPGAPATPGTLNAWLLANGGYGASDDDLNEDVVTKLDPSRIRWTNASMHKANDLSWGQVSTLLAAGAVVIANVDEGHHFVLVVGVDGEVFGDTLYVNDPGFHRASYTFKEVVGWRLYGMARESGGVGMGMRAQLEAIEATRSAL